MWPLVLSGFAKSHSTPLGARGQQYFLASLAGLRTDKSPLFVLIFNLKQKTRLIDIVIVLEVISGIGLTVNSS